MPYASIDAEDGEFPRFDKKRKISFRRAPVIKIYHHQGHPMPLEHQGFNP
jgi:hypothetical protein